MSVNGSSQQSGKGTIQVLSKREQMKLDQAIKIIESQEKQQIKHPKRKAHHHPSPNEPRPRKQFKLDDSQPSNNHDQPISSPADSSDIPSRTSPADTKPPKQIPNHLNPAYELPKGEGNIFNYLMCSTYAQKEKQMEKEGQNWSEIDQLGTQFLKILDSSASTRLSQKLDDKFKEVKDRLKEPLGKVHRQFNLKFLKKQFLTQ